MQLSINTLWRATSCGASCAIMFTAIAVAVPTALPEPQADPIGETILPISSDSLGALNATKLIGTTVRDKFGETIGKVNNISVALSESRVVAVILSSSEYLGIKGELSAVPPWALSYDEKRDILVLDIEKGMFCEAPHFPLAKWPDFNDPAYTAKMNIAFKVPAVLASASSKTVKQANLPTPMDQGNSKSDVSNSAEIRKAVMSLDVLSALAKNVKIITNEGRVTLRGTVTNAAEKQIIGGIADLLVKAENVDNKIDINKP